jgi:predicted amidohydrolase YtcJ
VLDREIFAPGTPAADILKAKIVMTVVGGEIVYRAPQR